MKRDALPPAEAPARAAQTAGLDAATVLRRHGCRATKPRVAVMQAILDAEHPVGAAELAERAARQLAGIHEATVYRTIATLSELGIVTHVHAGHGPSLVKLAGDASVLAVCRRCGRIERVPQELVDELVGHLAEQRGFALEPGHFALEGICADCA